MRDVVVRKTVAWLRRVWGSTWLLLAAVALMGGGLLLSVPWSTVAAWGAGLLRTWGSAGPVTLAGAFLLLVVVITRMVTRVRSGNRTAGHQASVRPIPMWGIWLGAVVVLLVGVLAAAVLVVTFGSGTAEDKIRLESIKLAGTIALGTGGGAALLLTARRQRITEVDLLQKGHDADERRTTELYTVAAQQLASDKAPVRLAGLYALERLGQSSPEHQQTIVNLFCAYLRMPDTSTPSEGSTEPDTQEEAVTEKVQQDARQPLVLDLAPTLAEAAGLSLDAAEQQQQEREVRLTAQGLLAQHLRPEPDEHGHPTNSDYWGGRDWMGMDLDLANATLHDWDFSKCHVRRANFNGAHFHGYTRFPEVHFHSTVSFKWAEFHGDAWFNEAQFHRDSWFLGVHFYGRVEFLGVRFCNRVMFDGAQFHRKGAWFSAAHFCRLSSFVMTRFHGTVSFNWVEFHGDAWLDGMESHEGASLIGVHFHGGVAFRDVWVRLDSSGRTLAPEGWAFRPGYPGDGREGQWGELVLEGG